MWTDTIRGKSAVLTRVVGSPATPDQFAIRFKDGSELRISVDANVHVPGGEGEATLAAQQTAAVNVYAGMITLLYAIGGDVVDDVDLDVGT